MVLIANIAVAQTYNNYNFNTQYSDQLVNLMEYETGYLLTGYITDSARSVTPDFYGAPVLIKLSKSGNPIDTLITTTFGYTELAQTSVYRNGYFYIFGTTNPQNDSIQLVVTKYDTSFNFIEKKVHPQLEGFYYINLQKTNRETDSSMFFFGYYIEQTTYFAKSFIYNYNFITMEIDKFGYIPLDFLIYNLIVNDRKDKYILTGFDSPSFQTKILTYDSSFNLLSNDTLFISGTNATLQSIINLKKYRDSLYLCLGSGDIFYPINNPTHFINAMVLQTLDSNFQIQDFRFWYYDSLTYIDMSGENALIENTNSDFFIGSTVNQNLYFPSNGLLIVKIDSNLNTLWKKHLACTAATMRLMNMLPTDDGGVLILYTEQASLTGAQLQNSKLVKIGSNGEVTSIFEFTIPIPKITIELFPNPASTYIELKLKTQNQNIISLRIIDINGKEILQKQVNSPKTKLDISILSDGVYIMEGVTSKGNRISAKFVKE